MKNFALVISSAFILGACSSEPKVIHLRTEKGQKEAKVQVNANRIISIEIEGMTCEMGCGGSIRKELKATKGVARVEFIDFDEKKKIQNAEISFDTNIITADEMVKIITTMNDKQFKVGKISSEAITSACCNSTDKVVNSPEEKETIEIAESNLVLPNLIDILVGIVQ
jgi:copper chaperone CopZ